MRVISCYVCCYRQMLAVNRLANNKVCYWILRLARRFHLTYTRNADDITFSNNHNVYKKDGEFMEELNRIIAE